VPPGGFPGVGTILAAGAGLAAATPFGAAPTVQGSYNLSVNGLHFLFRMRHWG